MYTLNVVLNFTEFWNYLKMRECYWILNVQVLNSQSMDRRIGILYGHSVSQPRIAQNCINKTINNIVLDVIGSRLANNHIIMIRQ